MPDRVHELHSIMPIANLLSVMDRGILSHERAKRLDHSDIAMPEIQERRDRVRVPNGLMLHQYANLYFHARNPMLFKRKEESEQLCILSVSVAVLKLDGVVISDRNASSQYARFLPPSQLNLLELDQIYAQDWRHPNDPIAYYRHRSQKCAEVLIPHSIAPEYIRGAYVVSEAAQEKVIDSGFPKDVRINRPLFFR